MSSGMSSSEPDAETRTVHAIPDGWLGVDIGPETAAAYAEEAARAATILWNGPMGIFEMDAFAHGTETVARGVANSAARSVVGGGDSLAAIAKLGLEDGIGHLSTGGGALLELVQGAALPGFTALERSALERSAPERSASEKSAPEKSAERRP